MHGTARTKNDETAAPGHATAALPAEASAAGRMGRASEPLFWTVETSGGRVQGIANGRVKQFKGVPYGASTAGPRRCRAPDPHAGWSGVRDCLGYGQVSPQVPMDLGFEYAMLINWDAHVGPGGMGEDCLNLNIWTPGLDDARRPVLVAFHGGGWTTGSGNGPMYDGAQLAMFGDAVVVTINHRLGALGYVDLMGQGASEKYADAGLCGVLDLIAALEWVRDNIGRFGGDPECVTIFGQSGGGSKVAVLMGAPAARGLFHRAVIQSPPATRTWSPGEAAPAAAWLMGELGLTRQAGSIGDAAWEQVLVAQARTGEFRPVADGRVLPEPPWTDRAPEWSAEVPVMLGTTLHDRANFFENFDVEGEALLSVLRQTFDGRAQEVLEAYRSEKPDEGGFLTQARIYTDLWRVSTLRLAELKAAQGAAAVFLYEWDWAPPAWDGRWGAFHAADLDASFRLHRSPVCGGGVGAGRAMSDRFAASLLAFARTGRPTNPLTPEWPEFDAKRRATLVLDDETRVVDDHRGALVRLVQAAASGD